MVSCARMEHVIGAAPWSHDEQSMQPNTAIDGPFYLVLMIVTITPTANTVMVMVELSDSEAKEGMARIIGWQYAVAPVLLSITVMIVVQVADRW